MSDEQLKAVSPIDGRYLKKVEHLREIFSESKVIVAVLTSMIGYGVMAMIMTATPLAMTEYCGYPFSDAAFVIQWHIVGMFAPSFFTGTLISCLFITTFGFITSLK